MSAHQPTPAAPFPDSTAPVAIVLLAADQLCQVLADFDLIPDLARAINCGEADTLAESLTILGFADAAHAYVDFHSLEDDEGDEHHERGKTVDAMLDNGGYVLMSDREQQ